MYVLIVFINFSNIDFLEIIYPNVFFDTSLNLEISDEKKY
jgi:hypothetical protein